MGTSSLIRSPIHDHDSGLSLHSEALIKRDKFLDNIYDIDFALIRLRLARLTRQELAEATQNQDIFKGDRYKT